MKDAFSKIVNDYRPYTFLQNSFLLMLFFRKMVNGYQPVNTFTNITIIDARQGLKYAFVVYQFHIGFTVLTITGWKVFAFGIFLVRLFLHTNTEIYSATLRIQSKYRKIRTRKIPNTDTFCPVYSPMWLNFEFGQNHELSFPLKILNW